MRVKTILTIILGLLVILGLLRLNQLSYLQQLREDTEKFKIDYAFFHSKYYSSIPRNKKDIEFMIAWMKDNGYVVDYTFFNYGYNIKYESGKSYLYTYGKDGIDNQMQPTPFNSNNYFTSILNSVPIINGGIRDFITSCFFEDDVILIDFQFSGVDCPLEDLPYTIENLFSDFQLYKGVENLMGSQFEQRFKAEIINFCEINDTALSQFDFDEKLLVYINRQSELQILCPYNLPLSEIISTEAKLSKHLSINNIDFFDHALFSLYLKSPSPSAGARMSER